MKPKHSALFLILILASFIPPENLKPLVIKGKYDYFKADNLNNVYMIKDDELIKYLPDGRFFRRYSNLKLGTITSVDVTNPLKILVYYRDFQQIIFLDNQLSVNS